MEKKAALFKIMKNYSVDKKKDGAVVTEKMVIAKEAEQEKSGIIAAEDQEKGAVKSKVFWSYIQACGGYIYLATLIFAALLYSASQLTTNLWLSWWSTDEYKLSTSEYLTWYGVLGVITFGFALLVNTVFLTGGYSAAKTFHKKALFRLMRAPMGFVLCFATAKLKFDSNPIGRILNRLSKDVESIDQQIWMISFLFTISISELLATASLLIYTSSIMVLIA
jgi:ATP-binding cassette subfamily C (CFTR/MRP) protein 1